MSVRTDFGRLLASTIVLAASLLILSQHEGMASESHEPMVLASFFGIGSDTKAPAADFELPNLNGSLVRLSKFKGERPVLIYFWATWCPYCSAIRPDVVKLREKIGPAELEVLAINVGGSDSIERLKRYQEGHPVSWPVLYDGDGRVSRAYKVQGIPLFVLVNKEGIVVFRDTSLPSNVREYLH